MAYITFECENCGERYGVFRDPNAIPEPWICYGCEEGNCCIPHLVQDGKRVHARSDRYNKPIHSDSLAISPDQVAEHKRMFPDIKIDSEYRPIFDKFQQHDDYLEKTGFIKLPQSIKPKGTKISTEDIPKVCNSLQEWIDNYNASNA